MNYWKTRCEKAEIAPNGVGARIPALIDVEALYELTELPSPITDLLDRVHAITWRVFYGDGPFTVKTEELARRETELTIDHMGAHVLHRDSIDRLIGSYGPRPDTVLIDPQVFQSANREGIKTIMQFPMAKKAIWMADEVHGGSEAVDYSIVLGRALGISVLEDELSEDSLHEILAAHQAAVLKVAQGRTYVHSHQAEKESQVREVLLIGKRVPHFKTQDRGSSFHKPDDTLWGQNFRRP
jgi:hypothetical protein